MNLKLKLVAVVLGVLSALAVPAAAQVANSGASPIALNAVLTDSVSVTLSANAVNFSLTAGSASNPGSTAITATTRWLLKPSVNSVKVFAYFTSSAAALTNTVVFGGANAGLQLSSTRILGNNRTGSHTDTMNFNINLAPLPTLPPGTYTGTLTIQAQAL
jgi:hypothetical protein